MKIVKTVEIAAPADQVFDIITDFDSYPAWNPWVVEAKGDCVPGSDNVVVKGWVAGRLGTFKHKVLKVDKPHCFHWCDLGWFTVFADGERIRYLQTQGDKTLYRVELNVVGPLAFIVNWFMKGSLDKGMTEETAALKQYAEQQIKKHE